MAREPRFIDEYLLYLLARASHTVSAEFHKVLRTQDVGVAEWRVLATLHGSGGESVGVLADACLMQQPTMTKTLDRMAREGLVERGVDAGDGRIVRVRLTEQGAVAAAGLVDAARAHEATVIARMRPGEAATVKALLHGLLARHGG
ncbi:MarR family winged helix-turn-helix transcriptional regulator [Humitalea sp. 24SJ18S-53]|uniref:MarR family winged helix-turn-helix transcriptional regulator n=1 Tax=Humitalea sp. 24SJ18S-53 TaxID=3422307 RepID=UPI003D667588